MKILSLSFVVVFGMVFLISLVSAPIKDRLPISEPLLALLLGALIGLRIFSPAHLTSNVASLSFVHALAEVTLAIALMTTALQVPRGFLRTHWRTVLVLLGLGMPLMWAASTAIVYLTLALPIWTAVLIAASITPTDPVLASTIVTGDVAERNIASRIRSLVIVESGANDGLAYAFVLLPYNILAHPVHQGLVNWVLYSVLWEVGGAILFGAALGLAAAWLSNLSLARQATEHASFLGLTLALSLLTLGALELIGTDAILGVFVAGLAFSLMLGYRGHQLTRAEHLQQAVERFFDLPVFVVLGAILPWHAWLAMGWRAVIIVVLILALRRPPVIALLGPLLRPSFQRPSDAVFAGWFGPIGISALFYATLALPGLHVPSVWPTVSLVIVGSIVAHGVTATPLTILFGRLVTNPERRQGVQQESSDEERVQNVANDVAGRVRQDLRRSAERQIAAIVSSRLSQLRQEAMAQHQTERLRVMREALSGRLARHDVDGPTEAIEEVARQIAEEVAQSVADTAASEVADRVGHNAERNDGDGQRHGDGSGSG